MGKILSLIVLIANIAATVDCLKGTKETNKKVIWLLVVWFIPGVGAILYFTIGKKQ